MAAHWQTSFSNCIYLKNARGRLENSFDFDSAVQRQSGDPDGRSCVASPFPQNLDDQVGSTVHHRREVNEVRSGVYETAKPQAALDAFEIAEGRLCLREDIDSAEASRVTPGIA